MAPFHYGGNLLDCLRQNNSKRQLAIGRQTVGIKGAHAFARINHTCGRNKFFQRRTDIVTAIENGLIRGWHLHLLSPEELPLASIDTASGSSCQRHAINLSPHRVRALPFSQTKTAGKADRYRKIYEADIGSRYQPWRAFMRGLRLLIT
jgi:hypothetical protein